MLNFLAEQSHTSGKWCRETRNRQTSAPRGFHTKSPSNFLSPIENRLSGRDPCPFDTTALQREANLTWGSSGCRAVTVRGSTRSISLLHVRCFALLYFPLSFLRKHYLSAAPFERFLLWINNSICHWSHTVWSWRNCWRFRDAQCWT